MRNKTKLDIIEHVLDILKCDIEQNQYHSISSMKKEIVVSGICTNDDFHVFRTDLDRFYAIKNRFIFSSIPVFADGKKSHEAALVFIEEYKQDVLRILNSNNVRICRLLDSHMTSDLRKKKFDSGICSYLTLLRIKEVIPKSQSDDFMHYFTEFTKTINPDLVDKNTWHTTYHWFPLDEKGLRKRISLMNEYFQILHERL